MSKFANDPKYQEAMRLHKLGFAIHWLKPKSKMPVNAGWTKGPRARWKDLSASFHPSYNIGVRLGKASRVASGYLAVIDCDVKSLQPSHASEMSERLQELFPHLVSLDLPRVATGRGNGSMHFYCLTTAPVSPSRRAQSREQTRVLIPSSVKPSKQDLASLSPEDIKKGYRIRPAWEIAVMGEGQQVVLPPSIHPDSGQKYVWKKGVKLASDLKVVKLEAGEDSNNKKTESVNEHAAYAGAFIDVDLVSSPLTDDIVDLIMSGEGCQDRSASLYRASNAMVKAGMSDKEILSVLTDRGNYLGDAAYDHAQTSDRARAANWVLKYTLNKSRRENDAALAFESEIDRTRLGGEESEAQSEDLLSEPSDWRDKLERAGHLGMGKIQSLIKNLDLIITNEVAPDCIKRDTFANREFYNCDTPWLGKKGQPLNDDDIVKIRNWVSVHYKFEPPVNITNDAITLIAERNSFHPVRDWIESEEWDGTSRIAGLFKNYLGVEAPEPYLSEISEKFLVAMVARVYYPGIKFDHTPIFEGSQGIGKSSFGRILVSDKWFADSLPDLHDKDAALNLRGIWLVEMSELAHMGRSKEETIKSFLTRQTDKVRPPFGRRWLELPRENVFVGTTNAETYLKDRTGNRRFWVMKAEKCEFEKLRRDRLQLFAEAKWVLDNELSRGELERWFELSKEASHQLRELHSNRISDDDSTSLLGALQDWLVKEKEKEIGERMDLRHTRMLDLFSDFGPWPNRKPDGRLLQYAAQAMKDAGFEKWKSNGIVYWRYALPPTPYPAPKEKREPK